MNEEMIRPEAKSIGLSSYGGRKKQSLLSAAKHNLREIQKEIGADGHIDAQRTCRNEIIAGPVTAAKVEALAQALRDDIGYKPPRKDYAQAHEIIFTLSSQTSLDVRKFFEFCLAFVVDEFGQDSVLSAVVHRDENAPHMHVLLVPIVKGQYVGSALITKPSLVELVDKFALAAQKSFGVIVARTLTGPMRTQVKKKVHDGLRLILGQHIGEDLLEVILKAAARNPVPFKTAMGITVDPLNDGGEKFRRIALSSGKGPKHERTNKPNGFADTTSVAAQKPYSLESGGGDGKDNEPILYVVSPQTPASTPRTPPAWYGHVSRLSNSTVGLGTSQIPSTAFARSDFGGDLSHISTTRVKDADFDVAAWERDSGEFVSSNGSIRRPTDPFDEPQVDQFWDDI
jgi:hypothetical protein